VKSCFESQPHFKIIYW